MDFDALSDTLKSKALQEHLRHIEAERPAAYFCNTNHGVELALNRVVPADWQPLFTTPACEGHDPVAWMGGGTLTQDRSSYHYRADIEWVPLFTARTTKAEKE